MVLFKFIESMHLSDAEQKTVDTLSDDVTFFIRTISGIEHTISINVLAALPKNVSIPKQDLLQSVIDKWVKINKE